MQHFHFRMNRKVVLSRKLIKLNLHDAAVGVGVGAGPVCNVTSAMLEAIDIPKLFPHVHVKFPARDSSIVNVMVLLSDIQNPPLPSIIFQV